MRLLARLMTGLILAILPQASPGTVALDKVFCIVLSPDRAWADESWKQEFEAVCARTGDAEGLP